MTLPSRSEVEQTLASFEGCLPEILNAKYALAGRQLAEWVRELSAEVERLRGKLRRRNNVLNPVEDLEGQSAFDGDTPSGCEPDYEAELRAERDRLSAQLSELEKTTRRLRLDEAEALNGLERAEDKIAAQSERIAALEAERDIWKDAIYLCTITESVHAAVKWMCAYHDEQMLRLKTKYYDPPRYPTSQVVLKRTEGGG